MKLIKKTKKKKKKKKKLTHKKGQNKILSKNKK